MCTNQPLKVMELRPYKANAFLMLFTQWIPIHQNILLHMWMGIAKEHV
jgi:hypothetical protein